jgi:hypothetical protein
MKYVIIGSGPTGLSLAYILALNNIHVELIEKDNQLGGSWNSQWIDNLYFSENSPRIFSYKGNSKKLMNSLGFTKNDFQNVYGNYFETNMKVLKFITKHFELMDYFIFVISIFKYKIINENKTLYDWMEGSNMSLSGKKAIKIISILICDKPENTNVSDFFGSVSGSLPKQMIEPNKWHELIELFLIRKNCKIYKNTEVLSLFNANNNIDSILVENTKDKKKSIINGDKFFICTQSNGIYPILNNSNLIIQNNWMSIDKMKIWGENTYYIGFGFQLHFDKFIDFKTNWCWSCDGDWTVIILPVSNWLKIISKDKTIKTVWSCCIVDMDTKSKRLGKTPNECSKKEILEECLFQINSVYNIPNPKTITLSKGLHRSNNKWLSKNTGFTRGVYGNLNMKGNLNNLFALGCFSKKDNSHISYMGTAIDAVDNYLQKYETINNNIFL